MDSDTEMGPLSNFKQLEVIEKNIKLTVKQGGKIKCGGKRHPFSNEGYYFPPTIIECENHNLPACLLYTSPSPRDGLLSRMPSSA